MSAYLGLRILKWVSLCLLGAGHLGGWLASTHRDRQRAVFWLATPGFGGVWLAGYGLARLQGVSMGSPWISNSLLLSLAAMQMLVFAVEKPERRVRLWGALAMVLLVGTLGMMTLKPGGTKLQPAHEEAA